MPNACWGGWVGDIDMDWPDPAWERSGTSFLARCLIETASSRRGETGAGCGSIAAFRSFPAKRDMDGSDVRHRDGNMKRDSPSFWSVPLDKMPAARPAIAGFSFYMGWKEKARRLIASSGHDTSAA